ncbi:maltodextrin phosphorylase [Anditalea andensis]|uniref:Alpha-1,4 glucan phosphorylase n=2 Tax=Anditalea andensis TaxID=1048983 RepID=A0A074L5H6_9BACT|nr:maltodextrin phosphorylase [Anditalea andensis]
MKERKAINFDLLTSKTIKSKRIGLSKNDIKDSFLENLFFHIGRVPKGATIMDYYQALAYTVRDRVFKEFVTTVKRISDEDLRVVAYLSAEYLPGPHLANNLLSLGITEQTAAAMAELGIDMEELILQEEEPGLGNGGLGRLASCYLDSMATIGIPSIAYGIRYEFGIFEQHIKNGLQEEYTDKWLQYGNPWEVVRSEIGYNIMFGGSTKHVTDSNGNFTVNWIPDSKLRGTAYDTPILGYKGYGSILRLWRAEAIDTFDFSAYNKGDYYKAVQEKILSENITKVLYPNDEQETGKELRLKQQYFFVSCSLQDLIRLHLLQGRILDTLHEKFAIQLNDTHPAIAVAELMRLLVDDYQIDWDKSWNITQRCFGYTNHTLLPEALEKWSIPLFRRVLPRHLEIIYEINHRFVQELKYQHGCSDEQLSRMALIDHSGEGSIRMAHLATVGSHKVNGVSALHSELLKKHVLYDFAQLWPDKFCNVTNGISPRRFIALSNPLLTGLITETIGSGWLTDLKELSKLENMAEDPTFQNKWMAIKQTNKASLSDHIKLETGISVDPSMMFDVHVKRIHEYKRQHLNVLNILHLYLQIKKGNNKDMIPMAFIFAGKAAPGYFMAKLIIKLITAVGDLINQDTEVNDKLKVIFLPDFSVKKAQHIYPAADLSEQISMAGKEASGTGNMKLSLNGALTIGTLDGANVEMMEEIGMDNFFLFGLNAEEVQHKKQGNYKPGDHYVHNLHLREVMDFLISGALSPENPKLFQPIYEQLLYDDPYMIMADFESYLISRAKVYEEWGNQSNWTKKSIINVARMGKFSSDRSIQDYSSLIWKIDSFQNRP